MDLLIQAMTFSRVRFSSDRTAGAPNWQLVANSATFRRNHSQHRAAPSHRQVVYEDCSTLRRRRLRPRAVPASPAFLHQRHDPWCVASVLLRGLSRYSVVVLEQYPFRDRPTPAPHSTVFGWRVRVSNDLFAPTSWRLRTEAGIFLRKSVHPGQSPLYRTRERQSSTHVAMEPADEPAYGTLRGRGKMG